MDDIKGFGLIICILMVLMAYLKQMIPRGKTMPIMRLIITVFILFSVVEGVKNFDFELMENYSYAQNSDVWTEAADAVADGLLKEFNHYLDEQTIDAKVIGVKVSGNESGFDIEQIVLQGEGGGVAKGLITARYQVNESCVEVMYE